MYNIIIIGLLVFLFPIELIFISVALLLLMIATGD